MATSAVFLLLFVLTLLRSARERRAWRTQRVHGATVRGATVRVAPAAGPMVAGVLRPEIVVPEWLLGAPAWDQRLVLAHEHQHVRGRDPLLLAGSFLLVALLPWHPAVWWMMARLRLAVEVDCDRRVLHSGVSRAAYGSVLLEVATRRTGARFLASALLDSSSQLERRLLIMTTPFSRFAVTRSIGYAAAAGTLALAACEKALPSTPEIERMDVAAAETHVQQAGNRPGNGPRDGVPARRGADQRSGGADRGRFAHCVDRNHPIRWAG